MYTKLNENTRISVLTPVGDSNRAVIPNSLGQGSFGTALASSLNIGWAVKDLFDKNYTTKIGYLNLNSLILQYDISKMNETIEEARRGAEQIDDS